MSVMFAGIKMGTYGFLRFSMPLLPDASRNEIVVAILMTLGSSCGCLWSNRGHHSA